MATRPAERPRSGARRRCSDPKAKGCRQFARRNTVPPTCAGCGGGTRTSQKHKLDPESGKQVTTRTGKVQVPPRVQALLDGTIDVGDLDEEELARGYPRSANGTFAGTPPAVIPKVLHDRMIRELFSRSDAILRENLVKATEMMAKIACDPEVDAGTRLKASQYIYERLRGKVPDVVVTTETKKWEDVMEHVYRGPRQSAEDFDGVTVDGTVVDDGRTP